jgi:hypothetical protein
LVVAQRALVDQFVRARERHGWLVLCAAVLAAACASRPARQTVAPAAQPVALAPRRTAPAPQPAAAETQGTETPDAETPDAEIECVGRDARRWGTTCCHLTGGPREQRTPGEVVMTCDGPNVGRPCTRKSDCDVACSCDPPTAFLSPDDDTNSPADGTRGVTGRCAGVFQIGVWRCRIDDQGVVGHEIVD